MRIHCLASLLQSLLSKSTAKPCSLKVALLPNIYNSLQISIGQLTLNYRYPSKILTECIFHYKLELAIQIWFIRIQFVSFEAEAEALDS